MAGDFKRTNTLTKPFSILTQMISSNLSLNGPISLHCFNHDKSRKMMNNYFLILIIYLEVAVCLSDNQVHVYQAGTTKLLQTLSEHTMRVTAIDWHPQTDLLLTCSMDRNAYVWQRKVML